MKTSVNKITNKHSKDPIDKLVFEKGLRIKHLITDKSLNVIVVVLNNGNVLKLKISDIPGLKHANEKQLKNWKLISGGVGIEWEELDEDLSLKGFINSAVLNSALRSLNLNQEKVFA